MHTVILASIQMIPKFIYLFYFFGLICIYTCIYIIAALIHIERTIGLGTEFPLKSHYEFIIVGGGVAGANILTGIDSKDVLLLEAGTDKTNSELSSMITRLINGIPIATPVFQRNDLFDWKYKTVSQTHSCWALNNNQSYWPMGKGVGGSQLLNNMIYVRGDEKDFTDWFQTANKYNYTKQILPFFEKFEKRIKLSDLNFKTKFAPNFMSSMREFGFTSEEFFYPKVMQELGKRWTVAENCILPNVRCKKISQAQVEEILFKHVKNNGLRAVGVKYTKDGAEYTVHATKGVILSAGTIGTPSIMLKSGLGPKPFYDKYPQLKMVKHLPAVGKYLQDHLTTGLDLILLNNSLSMEPWNLYSFKNFWSYFVDHKGPLTMTGCEGLGFVPNLSTKASRFNSDLGFMLVPLGMSIDAGAHMKYNFNLNEKSWDSYFEPLIGQTTVSIMPVLLHPKSRGYVTIDFDEKGTWKTIIDPQYLSIKDDVNVLVRGIKLLEEMLEMPSFKPFNAEINPKSFPGCEAFTFKSNNYWECYIRHLTLTGYHPVGTCRMGSNEVDSVIRWDTFQVHGVQNLFICDASIMPSMPSGNPQATVGMLSERFLKFINSVIINN